MNRQVLAMLLTALVILIFTGFIVLLEWLILNGYLALVLGISVSMIVLGIYGFIAAFLGRKK